MEYKAKSLGILYGVGEVFQVAAPLDAQIGSFKSAGIQEPYLIAPDKLARVKLSRLPDNYSRTSMAPVAIKGARTILVRNSPLMDPLMAHLAVKAHTTRKYFTMPGRETYEFYEAQARSQDTMQPEDREAIILSQDGDFNLVPEMPEAMFMFRNFNAQYFKEKVLSGKMTFYNLSADSTNETFINYIGFDESQRSRLYCNNKGLANDIRALGVLETFVE